MTFSKSTDGEVILAKLTQEPCSPHELEPLQGSGVYAYFLREPKALPILAADKNSILYVGMTEDGLDARNHLNHAHSGFSSFRRSLGALLRGALNLTALPRSLGPSKSNVRCYRFSDEGERALTNWMRSNLLISQVQVSGDVAACEDELIRKLEPPLNLKGWRNPEAARLKSLRAECARQAENALGAIP